MRKNRENQLPLSPSWPDHRLARELESISKILDRNPSISDLVLHDLCDKVSSKNGARGDLPPGTSPLSKLDLGPFEVHSMV